MELRLYDTLTREKRPFAPLDPDNVRMYVCGPTVYDFAHIGNARPVIVFDVLFRLLRHLYGEEHVTYVRNITDVDDKINARAARGFSRPAAERGDPQGHRSGPKGSFTTMSTRSAACRRRSSRAPPSISREMRTDHRETGARGYAYVAADHVLFSPQAMNAANSILPRYGALSNRSLDE